jgi:hypothetical protein
MYVCAVIPKKLSKRVRSAFSVRGESEDDINSHCLEDNNIKIILVRTSAWMLSRFSSETKLTLESSQPYFLNLKLT